MKKILPLLFLLILSCSKEQISIDEFAECKDLTPVPQSHAIQNLDSLDLFEGDIIINTGKGTAVQGKLWPNAIIPYLFQDDFPDNVKEVIRQGVQNINDKTYLEIKEYQTRNAIFMEYGKNANYVFIRVNPFANSSHVGMQGKGQAITFSYIKDAFISSHEFLHAAGLHHEQNRIDRDKWVNIHFENMAEYYHRQYETYDQRGETGIDYGAKLDTASIMIYSSFKTSNNGKPVITWKDGSTWQTQTKLSEQDILSINELYKCEYYKREQL